jgi:chromosome partitioning protein
MIAFSYAHMLACSLAEHYILAMKTIALISQKGGSGKTTTAINLAVASGLVGNLSSVVLIDMDPQSSASKWGDRREYAFPSVVSVQSSRLSKTLDDARENGVELAVIDTAPHSESGALAAARAADFILIPCRPSILDLEAVENTVDLLKLTKKTGAFLLTACSPNRSLAYEAEAALKGYGLPVCPVALGERVAFSYSLNSGLSAQEFEPKGKAANEVKRLYRWIVKHDDMQAC